MANLTKHLLIELLAARRRPLAGEADQALHAEVQALAPQVSLGVLRDPAAHLTHKREALVQLLAGDLGTRSLVDALHDLPADEGLQVVSALRQRRQNSHRARNVALRFLLDHPHLGALVAGRRQRAISVLRHALGERSWASVRRALQAEVEGDSAEPYLVRTALRHASDPGRAREALAFLAGAPVEAVDEDIQRSLAARADLRAGEGLPRETLFGIRGTFQPALSVDEVKLLARVEQEAARSDGTLTVFYKEVLLRGRTREHARELPAWVDAAAADLPTCPGHAAVVLDLSASMASSGERAQHPAALALALVRLLRASLERVEVYQTGGQGALRHDPFPVPGGGADLAQTMIEAARTWPQAIVVVTDGYENAREGDAAEVARGLRQLGRVGGVLQVVPRFAAGEDLSRRRLGDEIPLLALDHEDEVREVLVRVLLASARPNERVEPATLERLGEVLFGARAAG
jgi:hypothetical protein